MKRLPLAILILLSMAAKSQKNDLAYVFDADWKPTDTKTAIYLLRVHKINDTCWQRDYYNFKGPLIKTEQYRTNTSDDLNGALNSYNEQGYRDSSTIFHNGKRNGNSWKFSGHNLKHAIHYVYQDDSLVSMDEGEMQMQDSVEFFRNRKESEYPGGLKAWIRFMNKNLQYPERAYNLKMEGEVRIGFDLAKDGKPIYAYVNKSIEYSLDEEALRLIRVCGKWNPAIKDFRNVESSKIQPISFTFQ